MNDTLNQEAYDIIVRKLARAENSPVILSWEDAEKVKGALANAGLRPSEIPSQTLNDCRSAFEEYYGAPLNDHNKKAFTMAQYTAWSAWQAAWNYERREIWLTVGEFSIRDVSPDKVHISHISGEGGEFNKASLAQAIKEFYDKNF